MSLRERLFGFAASGSENSQLSVEALAFLCPACGRTCSESDLDCARCGKCLTATEGLATWTQIEIPSDLLVGTTVSHFRIVGRIGRGGMGSVYRALDLQLGRELALKFLSDGTGGKPEARFLREARAAACLDHPNIGTIYEVGEHLGRRFIAMALYEGETLEQRLAREKGRGLPFTEVGALAGQLASALAAAHDAGIAHRDVKPSNVMLTRHGRVKLLDFGIARREEDVTLTEVGKAIGTAGYMSPERLLGQESGPAADLWSFGVLLYEMLTGSRPFVGEGPGLVHAILHGTPSPLRDLRPGTPDVLVRLLESCLAKEPQGRPENAAWIVAELATAGLWLSGGSGTLTPSRPRSTWLTVRRAHLALLALVLVIFGDVPPMRSPSSALLYVALLSPDVSGSVSADDKAQVETNLQAALLHTVLALDGLAVGYPAKAKSLKGMPVAVARAEAVREVIASRANCAGNFCQLELQRVRGSDGRALWTSALRLPLSKQRSFADAVAVSLRRGYAERRLRLPGLALEINEEDYRTYLSLLQQPYIAADLESKLARLGDLRQRAPMFLEAYILEAKTAQLLYVHYFNDNDLEHGIRVARKALTLAPEDPRPLDALFSLALSSGNFKEAEQAARQMRQTDPAASLVLRGQLAERQGRRAEALELWSGAARVQPSWYNLFLAGSAEYENARLDEARKYAESLLQQSPGNVFGLRLMAWSELLRRPDRAIALLKEAARRDPRAQSKGELAEDLFILRRYSEAEESLRKVLTQMPDHPPTLLNLANCLTLRGRAREARRLYSRVVALTEPPQQYAKPFASKRALAFAHLGDSTRALETIQLALRIHPNTAAVFYDAAVVYLLVGDRESSLFYAQQAADHGIEAFWFSSPEFDPLRGELELRLASSKAR